MCANVTICEKWLPQNHNIWNQTTKISIPYPEINFVGSQTKCIGGPNLFCYQPNKCTIWTWPTESWIQWQDLPYVEKGCEYTNTPLDAELASWAGYLGLQVCFSKKRCISISSHVWCCPILQNSWCGLDECIFTMFLHLYFIKLSLSSSRIFIFHLATAPFYACLHMILK
jgi:hypothetical protein